MLINISKSLSNLGLKVAAANISDIEIGPSNADVRHKISERVATIKESLASSTPKELAEVRALHDIYKTTKASLRKNRPSIETLIGFIAKGRTLPFINNIVDIYNIESIANRMCMGAHDIQNCKLPISLKEVPSAMQFLPIAKSKMKTINSGGFAYFDSSHEIICYLNAVQGDVSKITNETKNMLLIVEGGPGHTNSDVLEVTKNTALAIIKVAGGKLVKLELANEI